MAAAAAEAAAAHFTPLERESLPTRENDDPVPNPGPSQLWYGQIYPLLNLRFTGATWYQGEANAGDPQGCALAASRTRDLPSPALPSHWWCPAEARVFGLRPSQTRADSRL